MEGKMAKTVALFWIVSLPGLLSATCSSNQSPINGISSSSSPSSTIEETSSWRGGESNCLNGWCSEDGSCNCNPCWSGSTCQEYVDRFSPRFLAEEPFFRVMKGAERDESGTEVPLFRIESTDDDLGLTCQLGQVGPAATCPCATPRYKVVGSSRALFRADPETGDVFIRPGYSLQQGKHYLITLQVAALEVNASGYHPWREEVRAMLYVRSQNIPQLFRLGNNSKESGASASLTTEFPHKSTAAAATVPTSPSLSQLRSLEQISFGRLELQQPEPAAAASSEEQNKSSEMMLSMESRWSPFYFPKRNATTSMERRSRTSGDKGLADSLSTRYNDPPEFPLRPIYGQW